MIDALVAAGWNEGAPGRGGVTREAHRDHLLVEARAKGEHWLWIHGDDDVRVLAWRPKAVGPAAKTLLALEDELAIESYIGLLSKLEKHGPVAVVAHEQFVETYRNQLTTPGDAMFKYFFDVVAHVREGTPKRGYDADLPDSEPPSAMTALRLALAGVKPMPKVTYTIGAPPFPDQREAKAKIDVPLWRHDGTHWHPAVPAPSAKTVKALAAIAQTGFAVDDWAAKAAKLEIDDDELRGAIAHASPPPALFDPFDWVERMQIAACLVLAGREGWKGSARRSVLFGIALGPVDWAVNAAILALGHVAEREPKTRADIDALFGYLQEQAGKPGYTCYAPVLATVWLRLGKLSAAKKAALADWGREAWEGGPEEPYTKAEQAALLKKRKAVTAHPCGSDAMIAAMR